MIQAENPKPAAPKTTISKVHGFSKPVGGYTKSSPPMPFPPEKKPSVQEIIPHRQHTFSENFYKWWHKIAVVLLTVHGLVGIFEAIKFMAIDYKELEHKLLIHKIQEADVNYLVAQVFIVSITTLFNMFMAIRLTRVREKTANNIDLLIATTLVIGTRFFQGILVKFDLLNTFIELFLK